MISNFKLSLANCVSTSFSQPDTNWVETESSHKYFEEKEMLSTHLSTPLDPVNTSEAISTSPTSSNHFLLHSFFNLFSTNYCSRPIFKALFSSFEQIFISIFSNSSFSKSSQNLNQGHDDLRPYIDPIIEAIALVSLETLNAERNEYSAVEVETLRNQAKRISECYPIGSSLFKILESRILMKQLYYTVLNDVILFVFPELDK